MATVSAASCASTPEAPDSRGLRIRTLLVSTSFPSDLRDWRGLFMRHLVDALGRHQDLELSVWAPPGETGPGVRWDVTPSEARWLAELTDAGGIAHLLRRHPLRGLVAGARLLRMLHAVYARQAPGDVLHVNWLQNALAVPRGGTPLLVTALGTDMQLLRLPGMRGMLRRVFAQRATVLCPNAAWMVAPLRAAFGDTARVHCVPFGIDPAWFDVQRDPPPGPPEWVCVSRLTADKLGPLFEWTAPAFAHGAARLHLFGPMQEQVALPDWVAWHGPATPEALRNTWFPRASGLITLSRHAEGRPQVMLEAMAAGLPVIASRLPAHEDLLQDGAAGSLCDDPEQVLAALRRLGDPATGRAAGARGRARVRAEFGTWDDCAARYVALYRGLQEQRA